MVNDILGNPELHQKWTSEGYKELQRTLEKTIAMCEDVLQGKQAAEQL
jgi:hypothetical protein